MKDPYEPLISSFLWSHEEKEAIELALSHANPWDHDARELRSIRGKLQLIKDRIKQFHLERQSHTCCYCKVSIYGAGSFGIDREHILPKGKYKKFVYAISNLSVSCKRCNMEIKSDRLDFLSDPSNITNYHEVSDQYLFIHPNFDKWSDFLDRKSSQTMRSNLVKYKIVSKHPKAQFTYDFFKLERLEVDSFNKAQGKKGLSDKQLMYLDRLNDLSKYGSHLESHTSKVECRFAISGLEFFIKFIHSAFAEGRCSCIRCIRSNWDETGYTHQHSFIFGGEFFNRRFACTSRGETLRVLKKCWMFFFNEELSEWSMTESIKLKIVLDSELYDRLISLLAVHGVSDGRLDDYSGD